MIAITRTRLAAGLVSSFLVGAPALVSAYEQPKYEVARTYASFELRRYAPQLVAETTASGAFDDARNEAFRRLFRYISGANGGRSEIAMTVPVTSAGRSEKVAMTAPVTSSSAAGGTMVMQFTVPAQFTADTVPRPTDARVTIREIGERWVAARRYSGRSSQRGFEREVGILLDALTAAQLQPIGEPVFAVYNGPFTPWFMRRNEVLVEVRAP